MKLPLHFHRLSIWLRIAPKFTLRFLMTFLSHFETQIILLTSFLTKLMSVQFSGISPSQRTKLPFFKQYHIFTNKTNQNRFYFHFHFRVCHTNLRFQKLYFWILGLLIQEAILNYDLSNNSWNLNLMNSNTQQFSQTYSLINVNHTHIEGSIITSQITTTSQKSGM